mgnify:FL=1
MGYQKTEINCADWEYDEIKMIFKAAIKNDMITSGTNSPDGNTSQMYGTWALITVYFNDEETSSPQVFYTLSSLTAKANLLETITP